MEWFLNEPFYFPTRTTPDPPRPQKAKASSQPWIGREAVKLVNKSLAKEVIDLQEARTIQTVELSNKEEQIQTLEQPHNVRHRMQRKDAKLAQLKEYIDKQAQLLKKEGSTGSEKGQRADSVL